MLHLDIVGCKKRKRCGRVFRFKNFGEPGYPVECDGPFRDNVKSLLEFGHVESNFCKGFPIWSFQLEVHRHPPLHIFLFVIEEPIEASPNPHCNYCQYIGWGQHLICNNKYHFLLPSKDTLSACLGCDRSCETPGTNINNCKSDLMELQGHTMHGVFHSNGFGHLLCVNGLETGSDLAGYQIMDFWDRLCNGLRARKVSLHDISQKRGMELRLLFGLAYGEPWFSRWGYKFGRGSFGVTQPMYQKAIEAIKSMPLYLLMHNIATTNNDISIIFSKYQTLSDQALVTLGDLFHFMLELKYRLPRENCFDSYNMSVFKETNCRWSSKRVQMATRVIVEALKRAEFGWVSRQEVRDAARVYIGDTGLLDFVLKSLGNQIVGNYLVRRTLNPVTKVLEYCLEDISNVFPGSDGLILSNNYPTTKPRHKITRVQLMRDMFYLYRYIVKDLKPVPSSGILSAIPVATRIILDTKYLIKEYFGELPFQVELGMEGKLSLYCTIMLRNNITYQESNEPFNKVMPSYECITLKGNATIDELKQEVGRNFRDIYWGLKSLIVESVVNLNAKGSDMVFGLIEVGRKLVLEGCFSDVFGIKSVGEIYEGNPKGRIVDCTCGTKDDDGERMISCDICEVWQHTRCIRIPNEEEIPNIFLCRRCEREIVLCPCLP